MRFYKTAAKLQRKKCFCKNKSKNRTRDRWHAKLNHHLALCLNSAPFLLPFVNHLRHINIFTGMCENFLVKNCFVPTKYIIFAPEMCY